MCPFDVESIGVSMTCHPTCRVEVAVWSNFGDVDDDMVVSLTWHCVSPADVSGHVF